MRVSLSTYESHGDAEPMVGLAVQFDTVAAVAEGCAGGGRHDAGRGEL